MAGMNALSLLFSKSGRLERQPFALALCGVYLASFLSQVLLSAPVTGKHGVWAFVIVQAALVWSWIALHIKRLRDAGRSAGVGIAIAILYVLALCLLILVVMMITAGDSSGDALKTGQGLIRIFLVLYLFAALFANADFGILAFWLLGFVLLLSLPVMIGLGYSIWAGTLPSESSTP